MRVWPRTCASRPRAKVESPAMSMRSTGSIWTATVSAMRSLLVQLALERIETKRGLVVKARALAAERKAGFVGFLRRAERAQRLVQPGEIHPEFAALGRNQHHALGNVECTLSVAAIEGAELL